MKISNVKVLGPVVLEFRANDFRHAVLSEPVTYTWSDETGPQTLTVAAGEKYNGVGPGNAPFVWILEMFAPRWGWGMIGAIPHDEAFQTRFDRDIKDVKAARKYADQLFLAAMVSTGPRVERGKGFFRFLSSATETACWRIQSRIMYLVVRWFGAGTWNNHDKDFRS